MISTEPIAISVAITAHKEGIVAHKTILSILENTSRLAKNGISSEIIVGLDNADAQTAEYYKRWENDSRFLILKSSFGNPAANRNHCIQHARGEYVSILDGDDLVSSDWLIESYRKHQASAEDIILHPNAHVHFDPVAHEHVVWLMSDSFSKDEDAIMLSYWNRWNVVAFAKRDLFLRFPYQPAQNGWGPEDYLFNVETRAADIRHCVTPGTVMFYRQMSGSTSRLHKASNVVLPYCELFDTGFIKSIAAPEAGKTKDSLLGRSKSFAKKGIRLLFDLGRQMPRLKRTLGPLARKKLFERNLKRTPEYVLEAWRDINKIENSLYPDMWAISYLNYHPLSLDQHDTSMRFGWLYKELLADIDEKLDYIFLAPELSLGGTEKLIANYTKALRELHPDWHFAVVTSAPLTRHYNPPENASLVRFGDVTAHISEYDKDILFSRLLVQSRAKYIHIINDDFWYSWAMNHMALLGNNDYTVYASLFMREWTEDPDHIRSFVDPWITGIYPVVDKIFTDNQTIINQTLGCSALSPDRLVVHYQPEDMTPIPPKRIDPTRPLRVLWASRLSFQKRPDILKEVASRLDAKDFQIDAYGREQDYRGSYLKGIAALQYKGTFHGISSLPLDQYDVFLYTSEVDGLPNVLLEMAAVGLPVVASDDGGVGEFIRNGETGILVPVDDIDGYVSAFQTLKAHPETALHYATNAQELLRAQHSFEHFRASVGRDVV